MQKYLQLEKFSLQALELVSFQLLKSMARLSRHIKKKGFSDFQDKRQQIKRDQHKITAYSV